MAEFPLHVPAPDEVLDAMESIDHVLDLDQLGEVDLCPYATRLLLQLEELLSEAARQSVRA